MEKGGEGRYAFESKVFPFLDETHDETRVLPFARAFGCNWKFLVAFFDFISFNFLTLKLFFCLQISHLFVKASACKKLTRCNKNLNFLIGKKVQITA